MDRVDLKSLDIEELKKVFESVGEKAYRGEQCFRWIHQKMVEATDDIIVLPKQVRDKLVEKYKITCLNPVKRYDSEIDMTKKYLFLLEDNNIIESVMMQYKHGISVCISTQVGCRMGCSFCASTKGGLIRNLSAGEMVDQIYKIQVDLNVKVSNIVLMGSGEPLDNYQEVINFLKLIHNEKGQNISYRNITLSTCGIVPNIYKLAEEKIPITLSVSLHSPYELNRREIMPISRKYQIEDIIKACRYYIKKTNRRVTFEYTLIQGVNDGEKEANAISQLLKGLLCHVNLLPLNPIKEVDYIKSNNSSIEVFKEILTKNNIHATIRREMGGDINAACGQLRRDFIKGDEM